MTVGQNSIETVHLIPDKIFMKQKLDMTMFEITLWNLDYNENRDGIRVLIVMKRKFVSEIMTTYFPSFLLLAITFATTFFKPFFFEAALSVNLTTMLVMTTIFMSKMEGLPPTSDIKMIDVWLVLCQIVPFAEVILLTFMEYYREDQTLDEITETNLIVVAPTPDKEDGEDVTIETQLQPEPDKRSRLWIPHLKNIGLWFCLFEILSI